MWRTSVLQPSAGEDPTIVSLEGVDERQLRLFDRSDELHATSATRTRENVDREDATHEVCPPESSPGSGRVVQDQLARMRTGAPTRVHDVRSQRPTLDLLVALATFNRDIGERDTALLYAEKLLELRPEDPATRSLVRELQEARLGPVVPRGAQRRGVCFLPRHIGPKGPEPEEPS